MTWEIVAGLLTLIGSFITIGKVISGNTKALTSLQDSIARLDANLTEQKSDVKELDKKVENHEVRISILEHE